MRPISAEMANRGKEGQWLRAQFNKQVDQFNADNQQVKLEVAEYNAKVDEARQLVAEANRLIENEAQSGSSGVTVRPNYGGIAARLLRKLL